MSKSYRNVSYRTCLAPPSPGTSVLFTQTLHEGSDIPGSKYVSIRFFIYRYRIELHSRSIRYRHPTLYSTIPLSYCGVRNQVTWCDNIFILIAAGRHVHTLTTNIRFPRLLYSPPVSDIVLWQMFHALIYICTIIMPVFHAHHSKLGRIQYVTYATNIILLYALAPEHCQFPPTWTALRQICARKSRRIPLVLRNDGILPVSCLFEMELPEKEVWSLDCWAHTHPLLWAILPFYAI